MEGNTAWVLASSALVLFMTPGLAFFYGGMVRSKNCLGMLMQNFFSMGLVSVLWALAVFSLAFGGEGKYIGDLVIGRRKGWPDEAMPPHSLPFTLLGTGMLWFGWFGFNAGSALAANGLAAQAFLNTNNAAAAAMLGWLVVERLKGGHATTLGAASGAVAGLVAITPCAGFVGGISPIIIGFVAGAVCFLAIQLKYRLGYDDALDVIGVHLVGGIAGSLLLGLFADKAVNPDFGANGLFFGGGIELLGYQLTAVLATLVWSGV